MGSTSAFTESVFMSGSLALFIGHWLPAIRHWRKQPETAVSASPNHQRAWHVHARFEA